MLLRPGNARGPKAMEAYSEVDGGETAGAPGGSGVVLMRRAEHSSLRKRTIGMTAPTASHGRGTYTACTPR
jgi:hypothetical protein